MNVRKPFTALPLVGAVAVLAYAVFVQGEVLPVVLTLIATVVVRGIFLFVERSEMETRILHGITLLFMIVAAGYFYFEDIGSPIVPVVLLGFAVLFISRIT